MAAVYRHEGRCWDYVAGSAIAAGESVDLGDGMIGIACTAIAAGATGSLYVKGVFEMTKATAANAGTIGDMVTVTAAADPVVDEDAGAGSHRIAKASAAGDTTAYVEINVAVARA